MTKTNSVERFVFVFVHLLTVSVTGRGPEDVKRVVVKEGSDAVLPCSPSTKADIVTKLFDWKKDGQKKMEVFMYNAGSHYNNGVPGQDEQFKGRVSHFPDRLKFGDASIKITQTKIADGGMYTCDFPYLQPRETFSIELVIDPTLKDRSENPGAGRPVITTPDAAQTGSQLRCQVKDASPKPRVEWKDSTGNVLPAHEPQVSVRGGFYDIVLDISVSKTDSYHCVVTQAEMGHQAAAVIKVFISDKPVNCHILGWLIFGMVIGAVVVAVVVAVLVATKRIMINCNKREAADDVVAEKVSLHEP